MGHKSFHLLLSTAALCASAQFVSAMPSANPGMDACRAEIERVYGAPLELQVVDRRRARGGTQIKLAASTSDDRTEFLMCWLSRDGIAAMNSGGHAEQYAATVEPVGASLTR